MSKQFDSTDISGLDRKDIMSIKRYAMEAITFCQRLINNYEDDERYENIEIVNRVIKCNFRILSDIADALEYSALDHYKPIDFNLSEYLDDFVANCRSVLRAVGLSISSECESKICIYADPERLLACLLSLVVNSACNVDAENGEIKIKVTRLIDSASITVIDNGYGMDGSNISELMDYNYSKGGLAVVSKFCKVAGTQLITDTTPDGGFMASIRLPLSNSAPLGTRGHMFPISTFSPFNVYLSKISDSIIQLV